MKRLMLVAVITLAALWAVTLPARQPAPSPAPSVTPGAPLAAEKTVEGTVKAIDRGKKQLTLEDGTQFTVPAVVTVDWSHIKPGTTVVIAYVEAGPGKAVRRVDVKG
jgi:hypothetical protein